MNTNTSEIWPTIASAIDTEQDPIMAGWKAMKALIESGHRRETIYEVLTVQMVPLYESGDETQYDTVVNLCTFLNHNCAEAFRL